VASIWLVCPVYRDAESFRILRDESLSVLATSVPQLTPQFLVVDDTAGQDGDTNALAALTDVRVLRVPYNLGHQRGLVYGLRTLALDLADDDYVVTLDADGEDQPSDVPRLLAPLQSDELALGKVALARRTKRRESLRFKAMYLCFRVMFAALTGVTVRSGNFAAFRGLFVRTALTHPYFDLCYSSSLLNIGADLTMVLCERGRRYAGVSRMSYLKLIMHGMRMMMPFVDRVAVRSLIVFTVVFALGIIGALVVVAIKLFTTLAIPGWATFTLLSALLVSLVSLSNFVVLFTIFSQSQGVSLMGLEQRTRNSNPRQAP
jgi:glycosyltransferase involved in cell wall biosynthesis